jgi:hypothetical protein
MPERSDCALGHTGLRELEFGMTYYQMKQLANRLKAHDEHDVRLLAEAMVKLCRDIDELTVKANDAEHDAKKMKRQAKRAGG